MPPRRLTRSLSHNQQQQNHPIKHAFSIRNNTTQQRKLRRSIDGEYDPDKDNNISNHTRKRAGDVLGDDDVASEKDSQYSRPMKALEEADAAAAAAAALAPKRIASASAVDLRIGGDASSLVPDFLPVQPIQAIPDPTAPTFRSKYNLYNPAGPRYYFNIHLTPPHTRIPLASTFSPSFPPIHAANVAGSPIDVGLMPGPAAARTPSGSPLPTPNASQTILSASQQQQQQQQQQQVQQSDIPAPHAIPARARKISLQNTNLQNANLLDASDPLGMNWHNPSPYDVSADALDVASGSTPVHDSHAHASGRTSRQAGRLPNPSPLSQSTSAVHLPGTDRSHSTIPPRKRTLSKPGASIRRLFSGSADDLASSRSKPASAPVTPTDGHLSPDMIAAGSNGMNRRKLSKRGNTAPSAFPTEGGLGSYASSSGHSKHSSMDSVAHSSGRTGKKRSLMNKLGRTLSVLKKPISDHGAMFMHTGRGIEVFVGPGGRSTAPSRTSESHPLSAKASADGLKTAVKRVPPPAEELREPEGIAKRTSASIDVEFPLTMGHLTITNPDQPSSGTVTPANRDSRYYAPNTPVSPVAPIPPPKSPYMMLAPFPSMRRSDSPDLDSDDEDEGDMDDESPRKSVLRVTNTPYQSNEELPESAESSAPPSPLLPPVRPFANGKARKMGSAYDSAGNSPAVISISLSTADFSSPPPPAHALPKMTPTPRREMWALEGAEGGRAETPVHQPEMEYIPDIASEPDPEASAQRERARMAAAAPPVQVSASPSPLRTVHAVQPRSGFSLGAAAAAVAASSSVSDQTHKTVVYAPGHSHSHSHTIHPPSSQNHQAVSEHAHKTRQPAVVVEPATPAPTLPPKLYEPIHTVFTSPKPVTTSASASISTHTSTSTSSSNPSPTTTATTTTSTIKPTGAIAAAEETPEPTPPPLPIAMSASERARLLSTDLSRLSLFVEPPTPVAHPARIPGSSLVSEPVPAVPAVPAKQETPAPATVGDPAAVERAAKREARREEREKARREDREREERMRREQIEREERTRWEEREKEERVRREEKERVRREREREKEEKEKKEREKREKREREERVRLEEIEREKERERVMRAERAERQQREEQEHERQRQRDKERRQREEEKVLKETMEREEVERERERQRDKEEREKRRREEKEREEREKEREREKEKEKERERARREEYEERLRREERTLRREPRSSRYDDLRREERPKSRYDDHVRESRYLYDEKVRRDSRYDDRRRDSNYDDKPRRDSKYDERPRRDSRYDYDDKPKREHSDKDRDRRSRRERDRTSTTEFRLVRSPSDNLRLKQLGAIHVGEERWTVVEAPDPEKEKRDKTSRREREKDYERSEKRRDSKYDDRHESSRRHHSRYTSDGEHTLRHKRSQSFEERGKYSDGYSTYKSDRYKRDSRYAYNGENSSDSRSSQQTRGSLENHQHRQHRSSDRRDRERDHGYSSHGREREQPSTNGVNGGANVERHSSLRRVVSDLPAGADQMLTMHAREAWTADRMWKGKSQAVDPDLSMGSIHGGSSVAGGTDIRTSQYSLQSVNAPTIKSGLMSPPLAGHAGAGASSSTTTYMLQPQLMHSNSFYAVPVYPAYAQAATFQTFGQDAHVGSLGGAGSAPLANPLPDPPRQSTYSPELLASPMSSPSGGIDDPSSAEYWRNLAGIETH